MSSSVAGLTRSFATILRDANKTRTPEDSIALRAATLAAVMTGAMAVIAQGAVSPSTSALVLLALPFAYTVSYLRRHRDNFLIKIAVTVAATFALMQFLGQMRAIATLDEVRFPLANLFLWIQVLHGFDLPARKDLNFSLGASLTLMAVAGSLSQDTRFGAFAIAYFLLASCAMVLAHRSELTEGTVARLTPGEGNRPRRNVASDVMKGAIATLAGAALLFLVLPQPSTVRNFSLPFSFGGGVGIPANGGIANPGFSSGASARSTGPAYYGFNDRLDLRVRGDLSDDLVMRVRASAPALWRGMVFEKYDGVSWTGDTDAVEDASWQDSQPFYYPPELRSLGPRASLQQTFYVEAEQPSAIFAAAQPDAVWFDGGVAVDDLGGIRTQSTLSEGTVYSVVSSRGAASADELRAVTHDRTRSEGTERDIPDQVKRFLELPDGIPQRVSDLAQRITAGAKSDYDRVKAIEAYLAENYEYSLDSPVPEEGRDAVDHFLFDTDVGFCEQFASATAVMLRSLGIPARFVAGYLPGERNPFTGYFEVRNSDAHTWVEAWFPMVGWYEFDPTFDIPPAEQTLTSSIPLVRAFESVVAALKEGFPGGVKSAAVVLAGIAAVVALAWMLWRRRRRAPDEVEGSEDLLRERPPGPVALAFRRLESAIAAAGRPRAVGETAAEFVGRTTERETRTQRAVNAFERERYAERPPSPEEIRRAVDEFKRLANDQGQS